VILQVAGDAGGGGQVEVVVAVALRALQVRVSARQRKTDRVVIETRRFPGGGAVALLAGLRQSERNVGRVGCLLVVLQVATDTGGRRAFESSARMAGCTLQSRVHSG